MNIFAHSRTIKMVATAIFIPILYGCFCSSKIYGQLIEKKDLRGLQLHFNMQFYGFDPDRMLGFDDSTEIYQLDSFYVYRFGVLHETSRVDFDSLGDPHEIGKPKLEIEYNYFVYKAGSLFGFQYDSLHAVSKRAGVDSFLQARIPINKNMFDLSNEKLARITFFKSRDFNELYIPEKKPDISYPDSSFYYYSRSMEDLPYSFSPVLDSLKKAKLSKVHFIYSPFFDAGSNKHIPRREYKFDIKPIKIVAPENILSLIARTKFQG